MTVQMKIEGLDELLAQLNKGVVRRCALEAMEKAVSLVHYEIARYPAQVTGRPQPFKTDKSRRWFFANLKAGTIEVPYRRSGLLGRSWQTRQWSTGNNIMGEVSNAVTYGPLVQGEQQAAFHAQGGWQTLPQAAEKQMDKVVRVFTEALDRAASEMAGG